MFQQGRPSSVVTQLCSYYPYRPTTERIAAKRDGGRQIRSPDWAIPSMERNCGLVDIHVLSVYIVGRTKVKNDDPC